MVYSVVCRSIAVGGFQGFGVGLLPRDESDETDDGDPGDVRSLSSRSEISRDGSVQDLVRFTDLYATRYYNSAPV